MIRILFLLLISFTAYGQAHLLMGLNRQREGNPNEVGEVVTTLVDNNIQGTGVNQVEYSGAWSHQSGKPTASETTYSFGNSGTNDGNNANDAYFQMDFEGFQVEWYANIYSTHGIAGVSIDGGAETLVDLYGPGVDDQKMYTSAILTDGPHTIKVRVTGTKNASSSQYYIENDGFAVYSYTSSPPPPLPTGDYYVAKTGCTGSCSDSNNGLTRLTAKLTIGAAAALAQPGDIVSIYAGTYRETIVPTNSGSNGNLITYQAAEAGVIISGLTAVGTSWTNHSGNIYKTTISLPTTNPNGNSSDNTTLFDNQIFKGSDMIIKARYPNVNNVEQMFDRSTNARARYRDGSGQISSITHQGLTDTGLGGLGFSVQGARIWLQGWFVAQTTTVSAHTSGQNNITYGGVISNTSPYQYYKMYYIEGLLALLNQANEYFYDGTTLYVWQTGGGSPSNIEYKTRNWGFDLRGKSYIKLGGLTFIGCTPAHGDLNTNNVLVDNIRSTYMNHGFIEFPNGYDNYGTANQTGIKLLGTGNEIKNSEFKYVWSQAVWLNTGGKVTNCKFEYVSYAGNYSAPIGFYGTSGGQIVNGVTINWVGRSGISLGGGGQHQNMVITNFDIGNFGCNNADGGGFYAHSKQNLAGTVISYGNLHDQNTPGPDKEDGISVGYYEDQASGSGTVHHVNFWNCGDAGMYREPEAQGTYYGPTKLYNCNFGPGNYNGYAYVSFNATHKDIFRNCIFADYVNIANNGTAPDSQGCVFENTNPLWTGGTLNASTAQTYFRLQSGSPARGIGVSLAGINDSDSPPKDAGSIGYGETPASYGYVAVTFVPD